MASEYLTEGKMPRKHGKGQRPPQNPLPQPGVPPVPVETETDKRQDRRITWTMAGTAVSFLVSLAAAFFSYRSAKEAAEANAIARAAQDRNAGKVQARFELVPEKDRDPKSTKQYLREQDGYGDRVFRLESVDELIRWGPRVAIKNTGTEPIDAIKTSIHYEFGAAYGMGVKQISPPPILLNEATPYESKDFGKLMPGHTAKIDVSALLLDQMTRLKWQAFSDKDHTGVFSIRVCCRLVGSETYDCTDSKDAVVLHFHWRPSGFKPDANDVKDLLAFKPSVVIE